jgi:hypothetical protein
MKKTQDNTVRRNATTELTPEQAKKKREELLERARKEAGQRGEKPGQDNTEDGALATFVLPGD